MPMNPPTTDRPTSIRPPAVTTPDDLVQVVLGHGVGDDVVRADLFDHFPLRRILQRGFVFCHPIWRRRPRSGRARCSPSRLSNLARAPRSGTRAPRRTELVVEAGFDLRRVVEARGWPLRGGAVAVTAVDRRRDEATKVARRILLSAASLSSLFLSVELSAVQWTADALRRSPDRPLNSLGDSGPDRPSKI